MILIYVLLLVFRVRRYKIPFPSFIRIVDYSVEFISNPVEFLDYS